MNIKDIRKKIKKDKLTEKVLTKIKEAKKAGKFKLENFEKKSKEAKEKKIK